jgi:serine/threonine protein kinase
LLLKTLSTAPEWWTPIAKAKAIVGPVVGLRFAHSLGLFHGDLTVDSIELNEEGIIHICDFCMNVSGELECDQGWMLNVEGISKGSWMPKVNVQAFTGILCEIAVGSVICFRDDRKRTSLCLGIVGIIREHLPNSEGEQIPNYAWCRREGTL